MFQSKLFTKVKRSFPRDEEAISARLLIRAGFIDKVMAGVYSILPLGFRVLKKIENIIREEMEAAGGQEILMPTLQPKANWQKTGRWEVYDSLFRFRSYYSKMEYALGPTHEEIVSPLLKKFVFSWKDLPQSVFQIQNKFRDEPRVKSGLLRTREFLMKDLYSFHVDENDLDRYYELMKKAYFNVFRRVGIGRLTYLTFASGGTFSKYSHEFQTLTSAGEDVVYLCAKCRLAVNKEIIKEQNSCPQCGNKKLKPEKAIEVGNIFKLKTKYSVPFGLKYKDEKGREKDVEMGCYGIGLTRLLGAIVEVSHDDKGIIWPESVAPFSVHLLEFPGATAEKLYTDLQKKNIEVLYDERSLSAGEKLVEADFLGLPLRLIVSPKTGAQVEIKRRNEEKTRLINQAELINLLKK